MQKAYTGRCTSLQHMVGLTAADMTAFNFPEGWGWVGGRKQGEKGVSFQKFAKNLILVFSLQGMDNFQRLDHTEALV